MNTTSDDVVDILVLGAGWTSQFLVPLLESEKLSYALTTTTGKPKDCCVGKYDTSKIIPFSFDAKSTDETQYKKLPTATTVIVTYKLEGQHAAKKLVDMYKKRRTGSIVTQWILLGSTGIYEGERYHNFQSDFKHNQRTDAEDALLSIGGASPAVVLCLAGLWGAERRPSTWVKRVASTKETLKAKTSLHLIHGEDVARACVAMHRKFYAGERWIVTDKRVYDWWDLVDGWADDLEKQAEAAPDGTKPEYKKWVAELMKEEGVGALPRDKSKLGRVLDSSKFWELMEISPRKTLTSKGENT